MWYRDSTSLLQIGQVLSRIKHLEPNTLQVGTLLSQYSHKKNIILGVVEAFQIHSQEIEDGSKDLTLWLTSMQISERMSHLSSRPNRKHPQSSSSKKMG